MVSLAALVDGVLGAYFGPQVGRREIRLVVRDVAPPASIGHKCVELVRLGLPYQCVSRGAGRAHR